MNTAAALSYVTLQDYLATEDTAACKSEYYAGEVFPMAGGTLNHNQIVINLCVLFGMAFKNSPYRVFAGDIKLHIPAESFIYPDVMVINGQPVYWQNRRDTVGDAQLLVEVLSDSTKDYDRGGKFEIYRRLPGLQDYVLISQDKVHVEHFAKQPTRQWLLTEYQSLADALNLSQPDLSLALSDIYDKVDFTV